MRQKTFNEEMKEMFGGKVYRLALSSGCTCPNRDGLLGTGGCIFCSAGGSGDFAQSAALPLDIQINEAKKLVEKKLSKNFAGYMAYFQSFTNTYGPVEKLRKLYTEAIERDDILALDIGTRPDCLPDEMADMLSELNTIKPVYVELGLQTIHKDTAILIRRGYELPVFEDAVTRLKKAGIRVIVHVIIGLPGEDDEKIKETVRYLSHGIGPEKIQIDGIKLQILQILKGTDLAKLYEEHPEAIPTYTLEEYALLLKDLLDILPENVTVHRLTGDPPKSLLIAPLWTADKKKVLNTIHRVLTP